MFEGIRKHFHKLLDDEPGERFQKQFHRRHKHRDHPILDKLLFIGGGIIVIAAGILGLPLPGPGTLIIIIGFGLLAQESLRLSKFLDWLEVEVRQIMDPIKERWDQASAALKVVLAIFGLIICAFIAWGIFWIGANVVGY